MGTSRRNSLRLLAAAAAAGLGLKPIRLAAAEAPPETKRLRLSKVPSICLAPQYVAEALLHAEGFTQIEYVGTAMQASGVPGAQHIFLASIATSVGLDPNRDIHWADHPSAEGKRLLAEGKIDAYLGFPPDPQELRASKVGHVLLNSAVDRPWSQYFCCLVAANREFASKHPIAAKRALRAILKASELCASEPDLAVKACLAQGYKANPEHARQAILELPYGRWRDYNPEETVRFYALRLREAQMVKGTPQQLIAQGTDWRFIEQIKREMKS